MKLNYELRELRAFLVVAEEQNLARAAVRLNISASPLSRLIRNLEQRLDIQLFDHSNKRLKLTMSGKAMVNEADVLLEHASTFALRAKDIRSGNGQLLRLGYVPGAMYSGILPSAISKTRLGDDDLNVRLYPMRSEEQIAALLRGSLDFAFVHTPPKAQNGLAVTLVDNDPFDLVTSSNLTEEKMQTPDELANQSWIVLDEDQSPMFREQFLSACRGFGFEPNIRYEVPDIPSVMGLIESGLGVGLLQSRLSRMSPAGVRFLALEGFQLSVKLYLVSRVEFVPPAAQRLLNALI